MKAAIYARFSSERQRVESLEGQIRECKEYANNNGITVVAVYEDEAKSATKDIEKRTDFLHMIGDSASGTFDAVIVWKLDRFARSLEEHVIYKSMLKKNNVKLISATETITESPEGILLESLLMGLSEFYVADMKVKINRGHKENALKAISNGGRVPFGYYLNKDRVYAVDPATAPIVEEIYKRYANGETIKSLIDDLNVRGIKTSMDNPFTRTSLSKLLSNRKYLGEYHYLDIVHENAFPAIISEELFNKVQDRRNKNKHAPAQSKAEEKYLLSSKLFCGKCGRAMLGESGKSKTGRVYHYYKCAGVKQRKGCDMKSVKKDWIENLVIARTVAMLMNDAVVEHMIDLVFDLQEQASPDIEYYKKKLAENRKAIDNMLHAIEEGVITSSTKQRLEELEETRTTLEKQLVVAELKDVHLSREQIAYYLYSFRQLDSKNENHRQKIIDSFVNAVYVFNDRIVLTYNYKEGTETVLLSDIQSSDLSNDRSTTNESTSDDSLRCFHSAMKSSGGFEPEMADLPRKILEFRSFTTLCFKGFSLCTSDFDHILTISREKTVVHMMTSCRIIGRGIKK